MAVPDTTNFHLTDVFTELGLPINGTNGLVQCFAAADPAQFDPAYEGSKNSLLNFRNYGAFTPIATDPVTVGVSSVDGPTACISPPLTRYIPEGQVFSTATVLYSAADGSVLAAAGFYSDFSVHREWNGASFVGGSTGLC